MATSTLVFPKESVWELWPVSGRKEIYVRECYTTALSHCHAAWNKHIQIVFMKGTSGVGKSVCLDYFLSCMISNGQKVLLIQGLSSRVMLFVDHSTQPKVGGAMEALMGNWAEEADYVLIDPPKNSAESQKYHYLFLRGKKTVAAVSPDPETLKKLEKDDEANVRIYLRPCSGDEALAMWKSCY